MHGLMNCVFSNVLFGVLLQQDSNSSKYRHLMFSGQLIEELPFSSVTVAFCLLCLGSCTNSCEVGN